MIAVYVSFPGRGWIGLSPGRGWTPSNEDVGVLARTANNLSAGYEYSPAHGAWGFRLAALVAKKLRGKVVAPRTSGKSVAEKEVVL